MAKPKKQPDPKVEFVFPVAVWKKVRYACFQHDADVTGECINKKLSSLPGHAKVSIEIPMSHVFTLARVCEKAGLSEGIAFATAASSHAFPVKVADHGMPEDVMQRVKEADLEQSAGLVWDQF